MLRSRDAALLLIALAACENKTAPAPIVVIDAGNPASTSAPSTVDAATIDAGAATSAAGPAFVFGCNDTTSMPKTGKSIGHTSVVFKVELTSGKKAAWKPNAKKVKGRYKNEVAAYRLAESLGIHNVPPACIRVVDAPVAATALAANEDAAKLFASDAVIEDGKSYGMIIPWIDGLQFWPLEKEPLRTEAKGWLTAKKEIPPAKMDLARQTSTLIAFDFMTGNWDRYSGENVGLDRSGSFVLYIDNDAAFMEGPPKEALAKNKAMVEQTDRFSRSFIARVRSLDEASLTVAFGDEVPGRLLLSKAMTTIVAARAKELITIIDAKIVANGESETLYFP